MRTGLAACAALAGATGLLGWGAARATVARIQRNPDPFPRQRLITEPQGEQVPITRPDGTVLHALTAGQGPPVILVHGYTASIAEWNVVWDGLQARGFRVIAFDQRGHGRSTLGSDGIGSEPMAADLAAVLRHFDVHDGVLVGHSMGGFVTIRAVLDHPDLARRLRGLVLFATWAGRVLDGAPQNRLQIPLLEHGILQRLIRNETVAVLFGAAQCGARPSPAMISVFVELFNRHLDEHGPLLPIVRAFSHEDRYPRLGEIAIPTVVMVGSADRTTPPSHSRRLAEGIPGARLVTVPDAGHLLNWEAADELITVVESFPAQRDSGPT
ncbi:alpha/beta hydrolase [Mycobacterium malmoense]|uniref:Alpha/beta hydrolase n=1 Tax=Mycobacterium malmoense TaxID=1780 RepID=A0ABX3SV15_MYCMA|nr:alpha/beta hydrolase [Mycobacterium malmoense]OIN80618.1 alpha/beta hydrolase [Mycobacterium malmoense]ORA84299.1 alpha/beta hydrolase [Mycobacterium malmoense]QZA19257.1 alpha/beta hydrolase [Mycobacterium malmoense]UNB96015.1 alpha/beta hydrolase [Mycobacterium malmoense]